MKTQILMAFLVIALASCAPMNTPMSPATPPPTTFSPTPLPTSTVIPVAITPSPLPTQPMTTFLTPDPIQVETWKEYEKALGTKLLAPEFSQGEILCEWELLGRADQIVYVWAFCQSLPNSEGLPASVASVPAVIHLGDDGSVQGVDIPGSGSAYARDVRQMFPTNIQELIFSHSIDTIRMEAHIDARRKNPEPPLIVLSATSTP